MVQPAIPDAQPSAAATRRLEGADGAVSVPSAKKAKQTRSQQKPLQEAVSRAADEARCPEPQAPAEKGAMRSAKSSRTSDTSAGDSEGSQAKRARLAAPAGQLQDRDMRSDPPVTSGCQGSTEVLQGCSSRQAGVAAGRSRAGGEGPFLSATQMTVITRTFQRDQRMGDAAADKAAVQGEPSTEAAPVSKHMGAQWPREGVQGQPQQQCQTVSEALSDRGEPVHDALGSQDSVHCAPALCKVAAAAGGSSGGAGPSSRPAADPQPPRSSPAGDADDDDDDDDDGAGPCSPVWQQRKRERRSAAAPNQAATLRQSPPARSLNSSATGANDGVGAARQQPDRAPAPEQTSRPGVRSFPAPAARPGQACTDERAKGKWKTRYRPGEVPGERTHTLLICWQNCSTLRSWISVHGQPSAQLCDFAMLMNEEAWATAAREGLR